MNARSATQSLLRSLVAFAAVAALSVTASAQLAGYNSLGSNSRGYVSVNQTFPGTCGKGSFFEPGQALTYAAGNATLNCSGTGWNGQSLTESSARTVRSAVVVTATNLPADNLVGLARSHYLDTWFIDPSGIIPTSVVFTFDIFGTTGAIDLAAGTSDSHTASFGFGFDQNFASVSTTGVIIPGRYVFSFAVTPDLIGRTIPIATEMFTFARLDGPGSLTGTSFTDYGNTAVMSRVDFFQHQSDGSETDVTQRVGLSAFSGANYLAPLATVPEPGTMLLVGAALVALFATRSRFRAAD